MAIIPKPGFKRLFFALMVVQILGLAECFVWNSGAGAVAIAFMAFVEAWMIPLFRTFPRFTFDRKTGYVTRRRIWIDRWATLDEIIAIQLCRGGVYQYPPFRSSTSRLRKNGCCKRCSMQHTLGNRGESPCVAPLTSNRPCFTPSASRTASGPTTALRDIKRRTDRILAGMSDRLRRRVQPHRTAEHSARTSAQGVAPCGTCTRSAANGSCANASTPFAVPVVLDLQPSDDAFDATSFGKNRPRLDEHLLTQSFFDAVVAEAMTAGLCSEHFSVDGTLIESLASAKSFRSKNSTGDDSGDSRATTRATPTASSPATPPWISAAEAKQ
ncbi:MAG: hypothetical protein U0744_17175 [Gemmataceae bacterium]